MHTVPVLSKNFPVSTIDRFNSLAEKILCFSDERELFPTIVEEGMRITRADYGTILLADQGTLKRVYASSPVIQATAVSPNGRTFKAFSENVIFESQVKGSEDINPQQAPLDVKTLVFIPLRNQETGVGVLNLFFRKRRLLKKEEIPLLQLFGSLASIAIHNYRLLQEKQDAIYKRDLFISLTSHEIKNPLTVASIYSDLIHRAVARGKVPPIQMVEKLELELKRTSNLIDELTQINQIRKGQLSFQMTHCSLAEILHSTIDSFRVMYPKRKLLFHNRISEENPCIIFGDKNKLVQVFHNLLTNAHKFSPKDESITITLTSTTRFFTIRIMDRGQGILPTDQTHIFDPFFKGSSDSNEGMGLGLYLVKRIISRHKGKIAVKSQLRQGTTFRISLPTNDQT